MALPKIKYKSYNTIVPSTGTKVTYRPFTVREEKILLTALEGEDEKEIIQATTDVVSTCYGGLDTDTLSTYDIEFLFLKLRAASVSDTVELQFRNKACEQEGGNPCKKTIGVRINLNDIGVQARDGEGNYVEYTPKQLKLGDQIMLTDEDGVTIKHPGLKEMEAADQGATDYEKTLILVKKCITSVFDKETVNTREEFSEEELDEWLNDLPSECKVKLIEYMSNIPKLRYETVFKCKTCGYEEPIVFEGIKSFFG